PRAHGHGLAAAGVGGCRPARHSPIHRPRGPARPDRGPRTRAGGDGERMSEPNLIEGEIAQGSEVGEFIALLDSWGFAIADYRISVWSVLVVVIVIVVILALAKLLTRLAHWSLGKVGRLDSTQRLLTEKLVSIAIWALAFFVGID